MTRKTAADFAPQVLRLFDQYVHGLITRQDFLRDAAPFAPAGGSAETLLEALNPRFAEARQVAPDDARLRARMLEYPSPRGHGQMGGYLVEPVDGGDLLPAVLVVHENRGLNPHIEDVARRLALEGFIVLAPDALHPLGGYPGDEDAARELFATLDQRKCREDFVDALEVLRAHPRCHGKVGVIGFCYGGRIANLLATRVPDLGAAVPFYGAEPPLEDVPRIQAPLQIHLADHDERINAGWPAYQAALETARIPYEIHHYPGTEHGFNNNTTPRFDPAAAERAWGRSVAFLRARLV